MDNLWKLRCPITVLLPNMVTDSCVLMQFVGQGMETTKFPPKTRLGMK